MRDGGTSPSRRFPHFLGALRGKMSGGIDRPNGGKKMGEEPTSAADAIADVLDTMSKHYRELFTLLGQEVDRLRSDVIRLDVEMAELRDEINTVSNVNAARYVNLPNRLGGE